MAKNSGKQFEENWKQSAPDYCVLLRIPDPPQSFTKRSDTKYSHKNSFDYLLFDTDSRILFCLELKSTSGKSISYEDINSDEEQNKMVRKHQILGLIDYSKYNNVVPCFIFNFRDEKNDMERTYFQSIEDFVNMTRKINKVSFNEMDLLLNNAIKIDSIKKRKYFKYDIDTFLKQYQI